MRDKSFLDIFVLYVYFVDHFTPVSYVTPFIRTPVFVINVL